ncbi:hypothetical protein IQ270_00595 [Microcoleus sp. LEGE 07076]|uniref:hypothetical protein n=1 Tax=Microcoleus sp. LEGE 07076 TaxID=915322 RepID=UPI001882FBB0|nr:hypothetical protein [Microcoleus sp. LEGE 07076]MBE9183259.1 hypothetical protein [Microcoleus sp. LEGE 07076]
MKEIVAFIDKKKQLFTKLPLFEFLANKHIHPNQRLIFAPLLAPFAVGLSDLNKYVLRESSSNNKVQELINKYTYKENYYWHGYLQHLETLGFNQLMSCGDFRLLWGEETQKTRSLCSVLERYAWKASPVQKLVLVEVLQGTATVFFEAALAVVMELQQVTNKEYVYFGGGYVGLENERILNTPEMLQVLAEIELTESEQQAALELVENVFELFTEAMKELFGHSKTNSCNTVLQVSSISAIDRAFDCLDVCQ